MQSAARHLGRRIDVEPRTLKASEGIQQATTVDAAGLSRSPIEGRLVWLPVRRGEVHLGWNLQIDTTDRQHLYDMVVDATDGLVWTRFDWTAADQYRVYRQPNESPNHATPAPPGDGRALVVDPANGTASPFGWHDTNGAAGAEFNTTQGNNAQAYTDVDANNYAGRGLEPERRHRRATSTSSLNLTQAPSAYRPAAVTNLFYWNNIIHDVQYQYGFDEAAGNFQVNNYGNGRPRQRRRPGRGPGRQRHQQRELRHARPTDSVRACRCSSGRRRPRTRTATSTTGSSSTNTATGSPTAWSAAPAT